MSISRLKLTRLTRFFWKREQEVSKVRSGSTAVGSRAA